jgi:hypothetical protein
VHGKAGPGKDDGKPEDRPITMHCVRPGVWACLLVVRRSFCVANALAQAFARTRAHGLSRPAWKEDVCPLSCALMARS